MMISALVSISIVSTAVFAGLLGISTASRLSAQNSINAAASGVATSQIDSIRVAEFVATPGQYPSITPPDRFGVSNATSSITGGDSAVQEVKITVTYDGEVVREISIIKANR